MPFGALITLLIISITATAMTITDTRNLSKGDVYSVPFSTTHASIDYTIHSTDSLIDTLVMSSSDVMNFTNGMIFEYYQSISRFHVINASVPATEVTFTSSSNAFVVRARNATTIGFKFNYDKLVTPTNTTLRLTLWVTIAGIALVLSILILIWVSRRKKQAATTKSQATFY